LSLFPHEIHKLWSPKLASLPRKLDVTDELQGNVTKPMNKSHFTFDRFGFVQLIPPATVVLYEFCIEEFGRAVAVKEKYDQSKSDPVVISKTFHEKIDPTICGHALDRSIGYLLRYICIQDKFS
jgi:hypothetical protein